MDNAQHFQLNYALLLKRKNSDSLVYHLVHESDFFTAPASSRYHSSYEGGLYTHSVSVYEELCKLVKLYNLQYSDETLLIVGLFHDLCKLNYYKVDYKNVKDDTGKWNKVPYYTVDDQFPIPHAQKSVILLQKYIKLSDDEILAISSHMGGFDKDQVTVGNAMEKCPLATLLHAADLMATNLNKK